MNVDFCDKNFVIAMFFRDYLCTDNSRQFVALPTILTHGVGACKFEEK